MTEASVSSGLATEKLSLDLPISMPSREYSMDDFRLLYFNDLTKMGFGLLHVREGI